MTTDALDVRFPAGRRVVLFPAGEGGVVTFSGTILLRVDFDNIGWRCFTADWFRENPASLRLVSQFPPASEATNG